MHTLAYLVYLQLIGRKPVDVSGELATKLKNRLLKLSSYKQSLIRIRKYPDVNMLTWLVFFFWNADDVCASFVKSIVMYTVINLTYILD